MKSTWLILSAAIAAVVGVVTIATLLPAAPTVLPSLPSDNVVACTMEAQQCPDGSFVGRTGSRCEFVCPPLPPVDSQTLARMAALADEVVISVPAPQSTVHSPLIVMGKAKGNWFFESTFPVTVETASGTVLGAGLARVAGDAMTSDFVPFTATITWLATGTTDGLLRVRRDNPSGLPEHDRDLAIPIRFLQQ